ncbi:hypothetical protein J2R91_011361 [Bradyrhizobium japonicum]|nr:hypothetical protein [Bradyrhizobium japonicum]MCP1966221.1 hypothetical protein [Bradyrhizobium japonicum]
MAAVAARQSEITEQSRDTLIEHGVNRRLTGTPYRPPKGTPLIGVLCW